MKTNQREIVITPRAVDRGKLRAVLREWGYAESEIHRVLTAVTDPLLNDHVEKDDQTKRRIPLAVSAW